MPIINSGSGFYIGRLFDIQLSAELRHRGLLVYKRDFQGNNAGIVSLTENKIILPDHFFVTGEKINYRYDGDFSSTANAIGITTTNFEKYGLSLIHISEPTRPY